MTIQEHQDYLLSLKGKDLKNELLNTIQNSSMPIYDKGNSVKVDNILNCSKLLK